MHETTSAYLMKENCSENARGKTRCGHNSGLASANQRVSAFVLELYLAFVSVSISSMTGFLRIYSELVSEWMDGSLGLIHHTSVFGSVVTDVYAPAYNRSSER